MANKIIHKHSSVITDGKAKIPTSSQLEYGEIAVNYADGVETITLKNSSNEIVEFKSKEYFENIIEENEFVTATALTNLDERLSAVEDNSLDIDASSLVTKTELSNALVGYSVTSHTHTNYAATNHASSSTTYGSGTTSNYGHVKLTSGDCSSNSFTNGVAAAGKHNHDSVYLKSIPTATTSTVGGIKVGNFLTINSGKLSVSTGTTSTTIARGDHSHSNYSLTSHTHTEITNLQNSINNILTEIEDNEFVTASALTNVEDRVTALETGIEENELVTATALTNLDERLSAVEENGVSVDTSLLATKAELANYSLTSHTHSNYLKAVPTASTSTLGAIKVGNFLSATTAGVLSVKTGTTSSTVAAGNHTHTNYAATNHASSSTTYGSGTTSNYGHVKLTSGDCSSNSFTNGVAAAGKHNHDSVYSKTSHTHTEITNLQNSINNILTEIEDNEFVTASALTNVEDRVTALETGIEENELVTATALTNLDERVATLESNSGTVQVMSGNTLTISAMEENVYYVCSSSISALTISSFATSTSPIGNYKLLFKVSKSSPSMTFPAGLLWPDGKVPSVTDTASTYELNIERVTYGSISNFRGIITVFK